MSSPLAPQGKTWSVFASLHSGEGNSAGRGGLGAVMGNKRLKAITVSGQQATSIADSERFSRGISDVIRLFKASPVLFGDLGFARYGTSALVDLILQRRMLPHRNFSRTWFSGASAYNAHHLSRVSPSRDHGCHECPIACKKTNAAGRLLPGFEALNQLGGLNDIGDPAVIIEAYGLCNDYGMDVVSVGGTLSAWGEIRGAYVTGSQLPLLLKKIALRQEEGDRLAEGAARLADSLGRPDLGMTVKGLEIPSFDPRGAYGLALAYCTSNRGACHGRAYPLSHEVLRKPIATNRFDYSGKVRMNKNAEDMYAVVDSLVACKFAFLAASLEEYGELLSAVTGVDYSGRRLAEIGERIYLTERFYNQQNGFSHSQDMLPKRFFAEEGTSSDEIPIPPLDRDRFENELQRYYRLRGLNRNGCFDDPHFLERLP